MSQKNEKIMAMVKKFRGREINPHYLGYFDFFNRQLFYEAHEVLEVLWLPDRQGRDGAFFKGLIQLAGAFVHLQKNRLPPAAALFRLAQVNLESYAPVHKRLDVTEVLRSIRIWLAWLEQGRLTSNPLNAQSAPRLTLMP